MNTDQAMTRREVAIHHRRAVNTFARNLRRLKEASGLTWIQIAERSGVSVKTIYHYMNNYRSPMWVIVVRLAQVFQVPTSSFEEDQRNDQG